MNKFSVIMTVFDNGSELERQGDFRKPASLPNSAV